jgi:hypothetical protein
MNLPPKEAKCLKSIHLKYNEISATGCVYRDVSGQFKSATTIRQTMTIELLCSITKLLFVSFNKGVQIINQVMNI